MAGSKSIENDSKQRATDKLSEKVRRSKKKNTAFNTRAIQQAVKEENTEITDEMRDPNFLTYLSDCFRETIKEESDFIPFSARVKNFEQNKHLYQPQLAEAMSSYCEKLAVAYAKIDQGDTASSMAGMKGLITVTSEGELFAYCMLLDLTKEEVGILSEKGENGSLSFSNQPLIMSCGIWYRTMFEVAKRYGLSELSAETTDLMYMMYAEFCEGKVVSESFRFGLNYARRIFEKKAQTTKRGRRPKEYYEGLNENVSLASLELDILSENQVPSGSED